MGILMIQNNIRIDSKINSMVKWRMERGRGPMAKRGWVRRVRKGVYLMPAATTTLQIKLMAHVLNANLSPLPNSNPLVVEA
jgi:predicted transcriptional regulator of viral defense system